jgi:hypothetical protein
VLAREEMAIGGEAQKRLTPGAAMTASPARRHGESAKKAEHLLQSPMPPSFHRFCSPRRCFRFLNLELHRLLLLDRKLTSSHPEEQIKLKLKHLTCLYS